MKDRYWEFTDIVLRYLKKEYMKAFRSLGGTKLDELNLLKKTKSTYEYLDRLTREYLKKIADDYYHRFNPKGKLDDDFIVYYLEYFDPVTKYQYDKETERKCARCYESLMASKWWRPELKTALKLWTLQATHYCEEIAKQATRKALKDRGVHMVQWVTADDERVCEVCGKLDGKVFEIDEVPPTPHYNCRCILYEYTGSKRDDRGDPADS